MKNFIHIHSPKERSVFTVIFLIIPILVFVGFVVFLSTKSNNKYQEAARIEKESVVLGDQIENIK